MAFQYRDEVRGNLVSLITIKSRADIDSANLARFIWNAIVDQFNASESDLLGAIKESVAIADDKLLQLIKHDKEVEAVGVELDLALVLFNQNSLYFAVYEEQSINILHEGELVDITQILKEHKVQAGSTNIESDDSIILSTPNLINSLEFSKMPVLSALTIVQSVNKLQSKFASGEALVVCSKDEIRELESTDQANLVENAHGLNKDNNPPNLKATDENADIPQRDFTQERDVNIDHNVNVDSNNIEGLLHSHSEDKNDIAEEDKLTIIKKQSAQVLKSVAEKSSLFYGYSKPKVILAANAALKMKDNLILAINQKSRERRSSVKGANPNPNSHNDFESSKSLTDLNNSAYAARRPAEPSFVESFLTERFGKNPKFKRLMAKFTQSRISSPSMKGMKIGGYRDDTLRKKRIMGAALAIGVALVGLYIVRSVQDYKEQSALSAQFEQFNSEVTTLLTEAENKLRSDSDSAELALFGAEKKIKESQIPFDQLNEEDKKKLESLQSQVLGISDKISKTESLNEGDGSISLFIDTRITFGQNSKPTDITILKNTFSEEHLFVTDEGTKSAYTIATQNGSSEPLAGADVLDSPQFIDVGVDGIYIYDSKGGVVASMFGENDATFEPLTLVGGLSPDSFGNVKIDDLAIFTTNDNVYLLSSEKSKIYKATRNDLGKYSLPSIYLDDPKLLTGTDLMGDFSIYVLSRGESPFNRFTFDFAQGKIINDPLSISGLKEPLQNVTAGYTGVTLDKRVYLFDQDRKVISVFEKPDPSVGRHPTQLLYLKQYQYRGEKTDIFNNVKDLVVDSSEQFLYILDGNSVWKVKL